MSLPAFLQTAGYRRIPLSRNGVGHFEAASTVVSLGLARELGLALAP
jgi:hypothetical protein